MTRKKPMTKLAGPSLRDKAMAGVPGAADKLRQQQGAAGRPNPMGSLAAQRAWVKQKGQEAYSKMTPSQRREFYRQMLDYAKGGYAARGLAGAAAAAPGLIVAMLDYNTLVPSALSVASMLGANLNMATGAFAGNSNTKPGDFNERFTQIDPDVKHFLDVIVPYIKTNSVTAGKPGVDYNPKNFHEGFYNEIPAFYAEDEDLKNGSAAFYSPIDRSVFFGRSEFGKSPRTQAHEFMHAHSLDNTGEMSSRSRDDNQLLDKVWGFRQEDLLPGGSVPNEQSSTNAEHQFHVMEEAKKKLGHLPSGPEFFDFIDKASGRTRRGWRTNVVNGYQGRADNRYGNGGTLDGAFKFDAPDKIELKRENIGQYLKAPWYLNDKDVFPEIENFKGGRVIIYPKNKLQSAYEDRIYKKWTEDYIKALKNVTGRNVRGVNGGGAYSKPYVRGFAKAAQSIVFGGGPPVGGEWGGDFSIPRQNPLKSIADAGYILNAGVDQLGRMAANKIGTDPEWGGRTARLLGSMTPVFGSAMVGMGAVDNLMKKDVGAVASDVATSRVGMKYILPKPVIFGGVALSSIYDKIRKYMKVAAK